MIGFAPNVGLSGLDVRNLWKVVKSKGKWGSLSKFKPDYRGTKKYLGYYGSLQGNVFLSNNAKVGGGPSNVEELEELAINGLIGEVERGRFYSQNQIEQAISQRLNNLYRLGDGDIADMMQFSEGNQKLFNSRLLQLIKGHSGRVRLGTR